jgi:hypothetical protein
MRAATHLLLARFATPGSLPQLPVPRQVFEEVFFPFVVVLFPVLSVSLLFLLAFCMLFHRPSSRTYRSAPAAPRAISRPAEGRASAPLASAARARLPQEAAAAQAAAPASTSRLLAPRSAWPVRPDGAPRPALRPAASTSSPLQRRPQPALRDRQQGFRLQVSRQVLQLSPRLRALHNHRLRQQLQTKQVLLLLCQLSLRRSPLFRQPLQRARIPRPCLLPSPRQGPPRLPRPRLWCAQSRPHPL